jgi:hypothetical protein
MFKTKFLINSMSKDALNMLPKPSSTPKYIKIIPMPSDTLYIYVYEIDYKGYSITPVPLFKINIFRYLILGYPRKLKKLLKNADLLFQDSKTKNMFFKTNIDIGQKNNL